LAPVIDNDPHARRHFLERYETPNFFEAKCLSATPVRAVRLSTVFRQEEKQFLSILKEVRTGEVSADRLRMLNQRVRKLEPDDRAVILCATNEQVRRINEERLTRLSGVPSTYIADRQGSFDQEASGESAENRFPSPVELVLKVGARVMFTRNDPSRRWVNGTMGVVESLGRRTVRVRLDDGAVHDVEPVTWESHRYEYDEEEDELKPIVDGSFSQLPLTLAWAVTVHKSQGKTFDAVFVYLEADSGLHAPGQLYVALSRCRRLTDIGLSRELTDDDFRRPNRRALALWNKLSEPSADAEQLMFSQILASQPSSPGDTGSTRPPGAVSESHEIRSLVSHNMKLGQKVKIAYADSHGERTLRVVKPVDWIADDMFRAYCDSRGGAERQFRVSRIQWAVPV
jgi:hypothetical protein